MNTFQSYVSIGKLTYDVCGKYSSLSCGQPIVTYHSIHLLGSDSELVDTIPDDMLGYIDIVVRKKLEGEKE